MSIEEIYKIYLSQHGISTDTRKIEPGIIFFALKGPNFNGNNFTEDALNKGASYAVIDEIKFQKDNTKYILVDDVLKTLQNLAAYHRNHLHIPVIGITGSNGKTTTKELIQAVLSKKYKTLATSGNLNNHIGVPLTILSVKPHHEIAVIEMGANHQGEIAELCSMCQPGYGLITNISDAHLGGFLTLQGVINAKNELYQHLQKVNGTVFVNNDNLLLMRLIPSFKNVVYYGESSVSNCYGNVLGMDPFVKISWNIKGEKNNNHNIISTQIFGDYNLENILAAICIGNFFKVDKEEIKQAIESYKPKNNRSEFDDKGSNKILKDAYNANPTSMKAAIENFEKMKSNSKVLILGDMLELGAESENKHREILKLVKKYNFKLVVFIGKEFYKVREKDVGNFFENINEAKAWKRKQDICDSLILIKGSREMKLENLYDLF